MLTSLDCTRDALSKDVVMAARTHMNDELQKFEERLNAKFEKVDQRLDQVDKRFDQIDQRTTAGFAAVEQRFDALSQRVGVLHEEAMAEFRFSLEAVQGAKEELSRKFDERADGIESTLELIARAVRANLPRPAKK